LAMFGEALDAIKLIGALGGLDPRFQGNFVVVKPMSERAFALHRLADFENAADGTRVKIRCRWHNTRRPWPIARYVRIITTVKQVRGLQDASFAGKV
jgi:hypothetical protein